MRIANYRLATFSASEAERIAFVSPTQQRDWRRHGYLPKQLGHARFNIFDLAEMRAMAFFSEFGIGPEIAHQYSSTVGNMIAYWALKLRISYDTWPENYSESDIGERIFRENNRTCRAEKYFVFWADRTITFTDDLNSAFDRNSTPVEAVRQQFKPAIVFQMPQIGAEFISTDQSNGNWTPFVFLRFEDEKSPLEASFEGDVVNPKTKR